MIINEEFIQDGISAQLLGRLINKHEETYSRLIKLHEYYIGNHSILNRKKQSDTAANNKTVCNHAKYIVDMAQSYLAGNPITYSASEDYDIEALKNAYLEQSIDTLDSEIVKNINIYGRAYELVYANGESKPRSAYISPTNAFVCYGQSAERKPLFGVHYYRETDIDGSVIRVCCCVYDDSYIYKFTAKQDNFGALTLESTEPHYFGKVPLIEYDNNEDRQGDFEQLIPLIDAYNILQSDRVNDKEQFVDAFLFLVGIEIDSEQAKKLKEEKILLGYDNAQAQYLSKVMSESDVKVLRDDLKEDIHRFSMVPDLTDESFGNNLSGVAIKYKLLGFEQMIKNKERYFSKGLRRRLELYNNFLALKGEMATVPIHRIDIIFTRNLPANNLEAAQMISNLSGIATAETLLGQLDFVTDAKEEAQAAAEEKAQKHSLDVRYNEETAAGGGY